MKLGFIGLGIMGESMSENLLKKSGHSICVYDKNTVQQQKIVDLGADNGASAIDVVQKSDVIFSMLPKSEHVHSVFTEIEHTIRAGQIFVDMSTISPKVSVDISKRVLAKNANMLDAPVVKSKAAAITGTLGIYVGGDKESFEKIQNLLLCIGNNVIHLGENGKGLMMKIIHNMLVGQIQNGVNEMIVLAQKSGVDIDDFITAISYGGGQNFYLDAKGKSIHAGDFTTAFSIENMHKDVHLAKDVVADLALTLPSVSYITQIYDKAMELGLGKEDFSATYKVVHEESGS